MPPADHPADGTRSALIVASDSYTDPGLRQLRAPASDAQALASVLRNPQIGGFQVRTLLNEPAHQVNLAVEDFFADRKPDDLLLVHFSCHGVKGEDGDLHFAASNTMLSRLGATAVAADFVSRQMDRSRSRRVVLLLDCCYAGAFQRGLMARAGAQIGIKEQFGGRGRAVITASSAMEYAFEGDELADAEEMAPSVFTSALVRGLETGDADRDQDGLVSLDELYDYVYDKVRVATPNQTPGKWTFGMEGDLYIARRSRAVTVPSRLPSGLQQAIDSPLTRIRAGAVQELADMLHRTHAGLALAARLALEELADDDSRIVTAAAKAALAAPAPAMPAVAEVLKPVAPNPVTMPEAPAHTPPVPPPPAAPAAAPKAGLGSGEPSAAYPASRSEPSPASRLRRVGRAVSRRPAVTGVGVAVILIGLTAGILAASLPKHTTPRLVSPTASPTPVALRGPHLRWAAKTGDAVESTPAVAGNTIFFGSWDHKVYALDLPTGRMHWSYTTGNPVRSSPTVSGGTVYIGSWDHKVYALDAATGHLRWSYTTGNSISSSPTVSGGTVYIGSWDHKVYALDAATGHLRWSYTTKRAVYSKPAVSGGTVFFGSWDGKVYAVNAVTGRLRWSYTTGGPVYSSPAVSGGTVYIGSRDFKVYALDAATGHLRWSFITGRPVASTPDVAGGTVYVNSHGGKLYALDAATGRLRWSYGTGLYEFSDAVEADGIVYDGSTDHKLYALSSATGSLSRAYTIGEGTLYRPLIMGSMIYVGSSDGHLYALSIAS